MAREGVIARVVDPDGQEVILDADGLGHILRRHPELLAYIPAVLDAVGRPDRRMPDPQRNREVFARRLAGPSHWLIVVVDSGGQQSRIVTAFGARRLPRR